MGAASSSTLGSLVSPGQIRAGEGSRVRSRGSWVVAEHARLRVGESKGFSCRWFSLALLGGACLAGQGFDQLVMRHPMRGFQERCSMHFRLDWSLADWQRERQ